MILVSGGAGVMGSRLVTGLAEAGNRIRVIALPGDPTVSRLDGLDCDIAFADVTDSTSLKDAFNGIKTVYHLASVIIAHDPTAFQKVNVQGVHNMVQGALSAGVEHFIYISSAAVIFPDASDYARSKLEGESIVKSQREMDYTIVRPTLVYQKGGGQEFAMFLEYLEKYPIVPFIGRGRAKKNPVYVEDVVKGLLAIANNPKTHGKTYNFSGGESISIWDMAHLMLKHSGMTKLFLPVPLPLCRVGAYFMEKTMKNPPLTRYAISRIEQDADLDNSLAKHDLSYDPIGFREGLQSCYPLD